MTKEQVIQYYEYMSDNQKDLIHQVIKMMNTPLSFNKKKVIELHNTVSDKPISNYDTSTPINYIRKIEEIYPNLKNGLHIFDYTGNSYGQLVNLNDLFANYFVEKLKH